MRDSLLPRTTWACRWGQFRAAEDAPASARQGVWACAHPRDAREGGGPDRCTRCPVWEPAAASLRPLRMTTALRHLTPGEWKRLVVSARVRAFTRGQMLFAEGHSVDWFCAITSGRVKASRTTRAGTEVIVDIAGPGDAMWPLAASIGAAAPVTVAALEDTQCVLVPREAFFALLEEQPWVGCSLLYSLAERLTELMKQTTEVAGARVEERLARVLLRLADATGRPRENGVFIPVRLLRRDLAGLTGTTPETCIRVMARLARRNLVQTCPDGFLIDRPALRQLLGERRRA